MYTLLVHGINVTSCKKFELMIVFDEPAGLTTSNFPRTDRI